MKSRDGDFLFVIVTKEEKKPLNHQSAAVTTQLHTSKSEKKSYKAILSEFFLHLTCVTKAGSGMSCSPMGAVYELAMQVHTVRVYTHGLFPR